MKPVTSGISRLLSIVMLGAQIITAVGAIAGAVCLVLAIVSPTTLAAALTARTSTGAPLDLTVPGALVATYAFLTLAMIAVYVIATQLRGLLASVARGSPFAAANVRRLHVIAGALAAMLVVGFIAPFLLGEAIRRAMEIDAGSVDLGALIGVLVVLVLAEVFREGVRLREESEGTI